MPIKAENKHLYPGGSPTSKEWKAIRARILKRAGNACENCKAPNGVVVARSARESWGHVVNGLCDSRIWSGESYMLADGRVYDADDGTFLGRARGSEYPAVRCVRIVLTIAHLDQDPTHNDDDNLKALCQQCHNRHDMPHRQKNASRTRRGRKAVGDLFEAGR